MLRLRPEKTYLRNFLHMGILFTVIILIFSYLLRQQYAKQAYDDINHLMEIKTDSLSQGFEYQLDHLRSYALSMYQDPDIFNWLMSDLNDPLAAASSFKSVSKFMSLQSFIGSTYLINMRTQRVIDSKEGIHTFADFDDQEMLTRIRNQPPTTLRFFNHSLHNESYLALIVPSNRSQIASQGYLVILLNKNLLETYLLQNLNDTATGIMIVDGAQNVILGGSDALHDKRILQQSANQHSLYFNNNVYLIHSHAFKLEDWTLYSTVKMKDISTNIDRIQMEILAMCLFLLLLLSGLTYWNSRRHFKPFSQLASQIKQMIAPAAAEPNRNTEFAIIKSGLDHMVKTVEEMNSIIRNHQEVIKSEFLRQWLLQGTYHESFQENKNMQLLLSSEIYLAVMRINRFKSFSDRYSYASRKLLIYAMGNITGEVMGRHGFASENVDVGSDHLVVFIGGGDRDKAPLQALHEAREEIGHWLQIQVTAALSSRAAIDGNMRSLYDRIYDLTLLRFFNERNSVYVEEDLGDYWPKQQSDLDEKRVQELIQAVRKSQKDQVQELLDAIFAELQNLSYAECQFQLKLLFFYIFKAFNKVMLDQELGGVDLLQKFDTLADVKAWIYQQLAGIIDSIAIKHSSSNRKEELAAEIFDYVKQHLQDPMLTLEGIADYLMLSVSYVRLVFKETYLITLSDFIHQERLEQAKQLLVSTDWPVLHIAERSGFQSKTTFFTSFKKYTGLTPNQYREQKSE